MSEISKLLPLFVPDNERPPSGTFELCVVESQDFDAVPIFGQGCMGHDDPVVIARCIVQCCNAFPALVEALEKAVHELNTIRARDGVPYTHNGWKSDVCPDYFSSVVDQCFEAIKQTKGDKQ